MSDAPIKRGTIMPWIAVIAPIPDGWVIGDRRNFSSPRPIAIIATRDHEVLPVLPENVIELFERLAHE